MFLSGFAMEESGYALTKSGIQHLGFGLHFVETWIPAKSLPSNV
jgi:hypothetical protein